MADAYKDVLPVYEDWMHHDEEDLLYNQIGQISFLANWASRSSEEKNQALTSLLRVECRYLGMQKLPALKLKDLNVKDEEKNEVETLGKYSVKNDVIYLSKTLYDGEDGYKIINVICHEVYHRYQAFQEQLYAKIYYDEEYQEYKYLLLFKNSLKYKEKIDNYVDGGDDFDLYKNQWLEKDSFEYAEKSEENYRSRIIEHLKEMNE